MFICVYTYIQNYIRTKRKQGSTQDCTHTQLFSDVNADIQQDGSHLARNLRIAAHTDAYVARMCKDIQQEGSHLARNLRIAAYTDSCVANRQAAHATLVPDVRVETFYAAQAF